MKYHKTNPEFLQTLSLQHLCHTSPIRCQERKYNGWTDPINYQFTRSIDPVQLRPLHYAAAAQCHFCFVTTDKRRTAGSLQLDCYTVCVQRSLCFDEAINDSSSAQFYFPRGVGSQARDMLERCMDTCGKSSRSKGQEEIPCTKGSISSGSTRILQAVC